MSLSEREVAILGVERSWWQHDCTVSKSEVIRDLTGLSPSRYYSLLRQLIDLPAAEAFDPLLVRRLRRERTNRRRVRFEGPSSARRSRR